MNKNSQLLPRDGFRNAVFVRDGKRSLLFGPDNFDLAITINTDDVNHRKVKKDIEQLLQLLEQHWPKCE